MTSDWIIRLTFFCHNAVSFGLIFFSVRGTVQAVADISKIVRNIYLHYHLRKGSNPFYLYRMVVMDTENARVDYRLASNMNADDDKCEDHHTTLFASCFCLIVKANMPLQAGDTYRSNPCRTGLGNTCRAL